MSKVFLNEKYRPTGFDGYMFQNDELKNAIGQWLEDGMFPNLLLTSGAGTGKSTLSKILVNEFEIDPNDVLTINASLERGIGFVRERLDPWLKKRSLGAFKVVQLEEADQLTQDTQKALRVITEEYSERVRFIMTANYPNKIIDALHSRFNHFELGHADDDTITNHIIEILDKEDIGIADDGESIMAHIEAFKPDIRKILNSIQRSTSEDNILGFPQNQATGVDFDEWVDIWSSGKVTDDFNRVLELTEVVDQNNFEQVFEVMYQYSENFPDQPRAIVTMSTYMDRAYRVANQRMNLDAFLYHVFLVEGDDE